MIYALCRSSLTYPFSNSCSLKNFVIIYVTFSVFSSWVLSSEQNSRFYNECLIEKIHRCLIQKVSGDITYCGHELNEFIPERTCAYISQHNLHHGEMTVRETLDFSGRCLGVGTRYELLAELLRREKEARIKPDPDIDAYMKATAIAGQKTTLITDYVLRVCCLSFSHCYAADLF